MVRGTGAENGGARTVFGDGGVLVLIRWQDEICISFQSPLTVPALVPLQVATHATSFKV